MHEVEANLLAALGSKSAGDYRELAVYMRDAHDELVGALVGSSAYGWFLVKMLWVAEGARSRGLGKRLMQEGEREALARGCHAAWLDTSNVGARRFYERLGYEVFGTLENQAGDAPPGHCRWFLRKRL